MSKRSLFLSALLMAVILCSPAYAAFTPGVTYTPTMTPAERDAIHARVEALSGDIGDVNVFNGGDYQEELKRVVPTTIVGSLLIGATYDSISRGGTAATAYPFPVSNTSGNQNEYDRKTAKFAWVKKLALDLGFNEDQVVLRQPDKTIWVEYGDLDAPEMIMALSHLDSPTGSVSTAQTPRWRGADGKIGAASVFSGIAYKSPYVHDGWLYGAGIQDDSGPTLATLMAAKALMDVGAPMDRRIRIAMGMYEDGGPGTPSVANTVNYIDIPFYATNPGFYDNWAYKYLNREECPIAGYTSDSRFPVIVGNSYSGTPNVTMNLASDAGKAFRLTAAQMGITERSGDVTLKDIVYGSAAQIASKSIFTLDASTAAVEDVVKFISDVKAAAVQQGWSIEDGAEFAKVKIEQSGNNLVLTINTNVAMEFPTPQYSKNAIVWGMYLLSQALPDGLQLKVAAVGITDLLFGGGEEKESYIGKYMGIPENLIRNPNNGCPNLTFALGGGVNTENLISFYTATSGSLSIPMQVRGMHTNTADHSAAWTAVTSAWTGKGFGLSATVAFGNATLYLTHDNLLTALQLASFKSSINHDPAAFYDVYDLMDIAFGQGTTGGTLAGNFKNKMTAFGAIIPGNERWWHTANERISVLSIVQMTKLMADGMLEMARYSGPAGAQLMWADIPGLDATRAELDLLDVTIGTYKDASGAVELLLNGATLLGATKFDIPMWTGRGNSASTQAAHDLGHASGGVYLPVANIPAGTTYVLPMRLEFKVKKPANINDARWASIMGKNINELASIFSFNILDANGEPVQLKLPAGEGASKFFYKRVSKNDPNTLYVSVNLAVKDSADTGLETVVADSKTDLYKLNATFAANNPNPFPERGKIEQRGFFVIGDGSKNARFQSPEAVFVTTDPAVFYPVDVTPYASVEKLNGNKNNLTITIIEDYAYGEIMEYTKTFSIDNNAAGTYAVGPYKVYVDTKGNTQIRACYIVK